MSIIAQDRLDWLVIAPQWGKSGDPNIGALRLFMRRGKALSPEVVINGIISGAAGSVAAIVQQGIGNVTGGALVAVAVGGAVGAYIAIAGELISHWLIAHVGHPKDDGDQEQAA